jgi:hypothetical protein
LREQISDRLIWTLRLVPTEDGIRHGILPDY